MISTLNSFETFLSKAVRVREGRHLALAGFRV